MGSACVDYLAKARALRERKLEERGASKTPDARAYRATKKYELITGAPGLDEVIEVLQRVDTVALDLETTGLSPVEDRVRLLSLHAGERTYLLDCFALDPGEVLGVLYTIHKRTHSHARLLPISLE